MTTILWRCLRWVGAALALGQNSGRQHKQNLRLTRESWPQFLLLLIYFPLSDLRLRIPPVMESRATAHNLKWSTFKIRGRASDAGASVPVLTGSEKIA